MKKFVCITILVIFHSICLAQSEFDNYGDFPREYGVQDTINKQDSIPASTIPHFRDTWKWKHNGVYPEAVPLDTLLDGIQNFNYIFKKSISNTYLGNFPSPYEANIFITRNTVQDFYPLTFFSARKTPYILIQPPLLPGSGILPEGEKEKLRISWTFGTYRIFSPGGAQEYAII